MMLKQTLLFLPLLGINCVANATTYYVSNTGNDANNGLSPSSAWKTPAKVNSVKLANGDSILFKRGHIFRGSISSSGFPLGLRFDAYGTGENPVIAGSVRITNWQRTSFNPKIYEANVGRFITTDSKGVTNTIEHLFSNGKLMTIARYPNVASPDKTNWLKVDASAGTDAFTDSALAVYNKPVDYWKGATLRIRTYSWYYKVFPITASSKGKITATGLGTQLPQWGYFIDGKLSELDYPGEWFYDAAAKKVYFYPPGNVDPNTLLIEGSTYKTGLSVYWHEDNTTVQNLTFKHFTNAGVEINSSDNVKVQNCRFDYNMTGIYTWNPSNLLVGGNVFEQQLSQGILLNAQSGFDVGNSIVEKNTFNNTGMIPLYCARYSGVCYGLALSVFGKAFTVRQNVIDKTGWTAIYLKADGSHLIENNVIRGALSLLNDGGAISVDSDNNIIRRNFLLNSIGNVDKSNGCASTNQTPCSKHVSYGMGLGADSVHKNIVVEGNTIAGNRDWAIRFNSFTNSKIRNNLLFNNESQITLEDTYGGSSANNLITGNAIYSAMPEQIAVKMTNATEHGLLDNNFYCNPYSSVLFNRDSRYYSFAQWRRKFPTQDALSKNCTFRFNEYATTAAGVEMFSNTAFNSDVSGWYGGVYEPSQTGMSGGSLKYTNKGATGFVNYNDINLKAGQFYRLRFRIKGSALGNVELRINDTTDYSNLHTRFFAYTTGARNYEYVFKSPLTTAKGQVIFISRDYDAPFYWLDNVSLVPVTAQPAKKPAQLFMNQTGLIKSFTLFGTYVDLQGNAVSSPLKLSPFSAKVLIRK
jgi:hypothetical protein